MRFIFLLFWLLLPVSCEHSPDDPYSPHGDKNFKRVEFSFLDNGVQRKSIGILNVPLSHAEDLNLLAIHIFPVYKGVIIMKSPACNIDVTRRFEEGEIIKYSMVDLIGEPRRCIIEIVTNTDEVEGQQHKIVESGMIITRPFEENIDPVLMIYKSRFFDGQGALQRQLGAVTNVDKISFRTGSKEGRYRVIGCGAEVVEEYNTERFSISLKKIFGKSNVDVKDSCSFHISVVPYDEPYSYRGSFYINVYSQIVKLANPHFVIEDGKIKVTGEEFVFICSINGEYDISNKCEAAYQDGKDYWIRTITKNGRKNVIMVKDKRLKWSE